MTNFEYRKKKATTVFGVGVQLEILLIYLTCKLTSCSSWLIKEKLHCVTHEGRKRDGKGNERSIEKENERGW